MLVRKPAWTVLLTITTVIAASAITAPANAAVPFKDIVSAAGR